jgi:DNA-binding NarL/FixJ family response regulator
MGGVECLRRLRQRDPGTRVIASSGYSNDPTMADHVKYGFDAVVTKPYRLEELSRAVHRVMRGTAASSGRH